MRQEAIEKVKQLAREVTEREGCVLYDVEFVGSGRHRTLRILIDGKDEQVSIDHCANVSRGLSLLLDVEDVVPGGAYDLEVSSPGVERALREPWHFERALEQPVHVVTHNPLEPSKQTSFRGQLVGATAETVTVKIGESEHVIPYSEIKRANVVFETIKNEKKNTRPRKS